MKNQFDLQQYLPIAVLAVAGGLLYFGLQDGHQGPRDTAPDARSAKAQQVVNKHLEQTAEQLEMQRRRMQIENTKLQMDYASTAPERAYTAPREGAELLQDQRSESVAEDLGVDRRQTLPTNPMDLIHHQLFEEQRNKAVSDAYKKEYARQFVENARRGGYDVQLSDDFRVLSVRPLRRPSRFDE